jgi:hypothetical protein
MCSRRHVLRHCWRRSDELPVDEHLPGRRWIRASHCRAAGATGAGASTGRAGQVPAARRRAGAGEVPALTLREQQQQAQVTGRHLAAGATAGSVWRLPTDINTIAAPTSTPVKPAAARAMTATLRFTGQILAQRCRIRGGGQSDLPVTCSSGGGCQRSQRTPAARPHASRATVSKGLKRP